MISLHDEATNAGAGPVLCRILMEPSGQKPTQQVLFPAGLRLLKGISIMVVAGGHPNFTVSVDYS